MSFAGLDPTGGAGLQADIEALASTGCHGAPVIAAVTVQDTKDVIECVPVPATQVTEQAAAVLADMPVAAFKIGLLGSVDNVQAVHTILTSHPQIPAIVDPVLASGAGRALVDDEMLDALVSLLFPRTTVLTPNTLEARLLAPEADSPEAMAQQLLSYGCEFVLLTGTHEPTPEVINALYTNRRHVESFHWERLAHTYHGSGCTLTAAIAGYIAQGADPYAAIHKAQQYTWEALRQGYRPGAGQHLPHRFYWASGEGERKRR